MLQKENFKNRVYGAIMVKAINANYNADFSGQPRKLPTGEIYSTDKANKYPIKNYIKDVYHNEKVLYFKRFNPKKNDFIPFSLSEAFCSMFPDLAETVISEKKEKIKEDTSQTKTNESSENTAKESIRLKATKKQVGQALLNCIDIRLFGATFAAKGTKKEDNVAISVHGPVQINYGVNLWKEGQVYSAQIMSPFRNPGDEDSEDKQATTLGRQSRLDEGHYIHPFSINPNNLRDIIEIAGENNCEKLSSLDIDILKEAMRRGVTWYDSTSKAGCENEMLVWVQLKEKSTIVLPNFSTLIELKQKKEEEKCVYDFSKLKEKLLEEYGKNEKEEALFFKNEVEKIEVYRNPQTVKLMLGESIEFKDDSIEGVTVKIYNI